MNKIEIITKWYKRLGFPSYMDEEFYSSLNNLNLDYFNLYQDHDYTKYNGIENLIAYIYFCEDLEKEYIKRNYSLDMLDLTLQDLVLWSEMYYKLYNHVGLEELPWCNHPFEINIFRFGRIELEISPSYFDIEEINLKDGDPVIHIHVPRGRSMNDIEIKENIKDGISFIKKNFPNFPTKYIVAESWLLDLSLKDYLKPDANILKFQNMSKITKQEESISSARFVLSWGIKEFNDIKNAVPESGFAERLKEAYLNGVKFHSGYGYLDTEKL